MDYSQEPNLYNLALISSHLPMNMMHEDIEDKIREKTTLELLYYVFIYIGKKK